MNTYILGLFRLRLNVDEAIDELINNHINSRDISVIAKDEQVDRETPVQGGAATGAAAGGIIGGLAALLVGVGAISIPGVGALLIGGPIITSLGFTGAAATAAATVTAGITGAFAGGLVGGLIGLGIPEDDARMYESEIKKGGILLAVNANEINEKLIHGILNSNSASEVKTIGLKNSMIV